ncbi:MAG: hypothetical protein IIZ87_04510, partial [Selenomonas sp.]|nr:hypothetical protein [Selenomonas sp.]
LSFHQSGELRTERTACIINNSIPSLCSLRSLWQKKQEGYYSTAMFRLKRTILGTPVPHRAAETPLEECLENQEISDIIMALGCGIQERYNSRKLNYGRVAIATDGDVDGYSIMCLISTMFYVLMPKFILENRLCWLRAPLYKIEKGNNKLFAYNDEELAKIRKGRETWEITRAKGLGELSSDDMERSMLHPTERRLEILSIHDAELAAESLMMLMGPEVEGRRQFLFNNVDFSIINR